ncbi:MAG: hypothetical protein RQ715_07000 [Methylococcales bacterium]|nr:hypothetical protein [Methylococcales bacterium]
MLTPVLDLDRQLVALDENQALPLASLQNLDAPCQVLTDFGGSVFGVEALSVTPNHVPAVLEKRLRDDGILDGFGEILIHQVSRVGDLSLVLYTAILAKNYVRYVQLANDQKDHCLLIPIASLLKRQLECDKSQVAAVVFEHDRHLDVMVADKGQVIWADRLTMFSPDGEDFERTLDELNSALTRLTQRGYAKPEHIKWFRHQIRKIDRSEQIELFASQYAYSLDSVNTMEIRIDDAKIYDSSVTTLLQKANYKDYCNPISDKAPVLVEKLLPYIGGALLIASVIFLVLGIAWTFGERQLSLQLQQLLESPGARELADIQNKVDRLLKEQTEQAGNVVQLASAFESAVSLPNLTKLLTDIKDATPEVINIRTIRIDNTNPEAPSIIVEGWAETFDQTVSGEENMSIALRNQGYRLEGRSLAVRREDNTFTFALLWPNKSL